MTERVQRFLDLLRKKEYRKDRTVNDIDVTEEVNGSHEGLRDTIVLERMLEGETPVILEGDIFGFNRKQSKLPYYYNANGRLVDSGPGNVTPNYARVISTGYDKLLADIEKYKKINKDSDSAIFYEALERSVKVSLDSAEKYRLAAIEAGNERLADALSRIPRKGAESFYEACVFFKFIVYTLRCSHATHLTIGRFDQYMLPFYEADLARGVTREELFEILELFFISLNLDGDIYFGIQQGDNGQSMVLGGFDKYGNYQFNGLSELCMQASLELSLIDPKINLRVGKATPDYIYDLGTKLTKKGLGFPQYCNDDIIIPYMLSLGYAEEDAYNYTVAACWEVLSPNNGHDVPNMRPYSFPTVVNRAVHSYLCDSPDFESFMEKVQLCINEQLDEFVESCDYRNHPEKKSTHNMLLSAFVDGCIEKGLDLTRGGAKYNNYGLLGTGIANAADALAAIKKLVFDDKTVSAETLIAALNANYEGYGELRNMILSAPKMGNNNDYVDSLAAEIMNIAADRVHGRPTGNFGGVWRIGTGSAQSYVKASRNLEATADGRLAFEPFACSFSPAIATRTKGPLSVLASFTKHDLSRMCNGGPLTVELHDTVFRNEEGERKVAQFVKAFVMLGGHQLQLNSINRDVLLDAKAHPEDHPNLIVRVWGWSGYFCELDKEYQDHIISRTEYTF